MAEKKIFTGPSKKRKAVGRKAISAMRMEDVNRTLIKAIEAIQGPEVEALVELVARKVDSGSATVRYVVPARGKISKVNIGMVDWIARKHGGSMDDKNIAIIGNEERITLSFRFPSRKQAQAFKKDAKVPFKHHDLKAIIERLILDGPPL